MLVASSTQIMKNILDGTKQITLPTFGRLPEMRNPYERVADSDKLKADYSKSLREIKRGVREFARTK